MMRKKGTIEMKNTEEMNWEKAFQDPVVRSAEILRLNLDMALLADTTKESIKEHDMLKESLVYIVKYIVKWGIEYERQSHPLQ